MLGGKRLKAHGCCHPKYYGWEATTFRWEKRSWCRLHWVRHSEIRAHKLDGRRTSRELVELVAVESRQVCAAVLCRAQGLALSGKQIAGMSGEMMPLFGFTGIWYYCLLSCWLLRASLVVHACPYSCHPVSLLGCQASFYSPFIPTGAAKMMMTGRMNQIS